MKTIKLIMLCLMGLSWSACNQNKDEVKAHASLNTTADNQLIGTMEFFEQANGQVKMVMELNMHTRADSSVAVHFHEHGDCGNMGEDAHGHWNPTGENHGKWGVEPYHSGDIGNIALDATGHASYSIVTDRWSLKEGDPNYIGNLGVIVHGGVDDYTTQPTGNSGPRIGCGIIKINR
ncbi:MAG: superoxide dismutase family protein [Pedobacter sp.]|jgi:Cu-Zn family superoxide dismutase|nr:MAG: superoxide dismutase family protein [Pedobacter sp.]